MNEHQQPTSKGSIFSNFRYIRMWFYATTISLVVTLILAWVFYAGTYRFWENYISHLGTKEIWGTSIPNTTSRMIFSIGMGLCGLFALIMGQLYFFHPDKTKLTKTKGILMLFLVIGAILIGFPLDGNHPNIHRIGAALFFLVFDIYIFFCQFTRYKNKKISFDTDDKKPLTFEKIVVLILLLCTLGYFVLITLDLVTDIDVIAVLPIAQKINVILFLCVTLMLDKEDF